MDIYTSAMKAIADCFLRRFNRFDFVLKRFSAVFTPKAETMMKNFLSLRLHLATALSLVLFLLVGAAQAQNGAEGKSPVLYAEIPFLQQQWPSVIAFRADFASLLTAAGVAQPFQEETLSAQTGDSEQPLPLSLQKEGEVFKVLVQVPGADKQSEISAKNHPSAIWRCASQAALQATENLVWNGDFSLLDQAGHPVALNLRKEAFNLVEGTGGGRALAFNSTAEKRIQLTTPWIRIPECSKLEYSFRYRTEGGKAHHYNVVAYAYVNFLDRDGKRLPRQSILSSHVKPAMAGRKSAALTLRQRQLQLILSSTAPAVCLVRSSWMKSG